LNINEIPIFYRGKKKKDFQLISKFDLLKRIVAISPKISNFKTDVKHQHNRKNMKPKFCSTCGSSLKLEMRDRERLVCSDETCDFVSWNNPIPVVGAIVQQGENIILVQNIGWPKHWYALVTGFLEAGETPEEGIKREMEEEIGLAPTEVNFVGMYPFHRMNQLLIIFHAKVDENAEVKLQADELADYRKVLIEEIQPWDAGTGHAVRDWLRTKGIERDLIPLNEIK